MIMELPIEVLLKSISRMKDGFFVVDAKQKNLPIIYTNKSYLKITGYGLDVIIGRSLYHLHGTETSEKIEQRIKKCILDKKSGSFQLVNYKKNSTKFINHLSITPIKNRLGFVEFYIGIVRDITVTKQLAKQQNQNHAMTVTLRTINDIIFNYVNTIQLFKDSLSPYGVDKKILVNFQRDLDRTIKKIRNVSKMPEFQETIISRNVHVLNVNDDLMK